MLTLDDILNELRSQIAGWFGNWLDQKPVAATVAFPFSYETDVRKFFADHGAACGPARLYEGNGRHMRQMEVTLC